MPAAPRLQVQRVRQVPNRRPARAQQQSVAAAYGTTMVGRYPQITRQGFDRCRVVHRELVSDVNSRTVFTAVKYICNPGDPNTFPWLANEARGWERYRFEKLRFVYVTRTSTASIGSFLMAPDYDATDSAPVSESQLSAYSESVESSLWQGVQCDLRVASMHADAKEKYVRTGYERVANATVSDLRLTDAANLYLSCFSDSLADETFVGKLWVEYDVTLHTPQIPSGGLPQTAVYQVVGTEPALTAAAPFGPVNYIPSTLNFGQIRGSFEIVSGGGLNLVFRQLIVGASYYVTVTIDGTVITAGLAYASAVGMTLISTPQPAIFPAAATTSCAVYGFVATSKQATITWTLTATTVTNTIVLVALIAPYTDLA